MAKVTKRKPTPQTTTTRVSPLKPGLRNARNWATAQMRAASYSRAGALRMTGIVSAVLIAVTVCGLWLGGFMPNVRQAGSDFTKNRLISMGFTVDKIDVVGEGRIREGEVRAALGVRSGDYLFDIDMRAAQKRVQSLSWIDDAVVRRLWPDSVVVYIIERQPVALWQHNAQVSVIDDNGAVIEAALAENFADLPFIVGANAAENSQYIYEALQAAPSVASHLEAIIHIGDRRWDIALADGRPRLMLPEDNPQAALKKLEYLQATHRILDLNLELIDLRVPGRMIVRKNSVGIGRGGAA